MDGFRQSHALRHLHAPVPRPRGSTGSTSTQIAAYGFEPSRSSPPASTSTTTTRRPSHALAGSGSARRGCGLNGIHAPITEAFSRGRQVGRRRSRTPAADRRGARRRSRETEAALELARRVPVRRAGRAPRARPRPGAAAGDNNRATRRARALEEICRLAEPLGVRLAFEVIPNELSTPQRWSTLLERRPRRAGTPASASTSATRTCSATSSTPSRRVGRAPDRDARARQPRRERRAPGARSRADRLGRRR